MDICNKCNLFEEYDDGEHNPNNCIKYLCNDGSCPNDKKITEELEKFKIEKLGE